MSDQIPSELINNILSRLPLQRILYCKCVCKTWRRMIEDPHFAKLHKAYHKDDIGFLIVKHQDEKVSLLSLDFNKKFETRNIEIVCSQLYMGLCNGFILLSQSENKNRELFTIWNPLTKELQKLRKAPNSVEFFDFGYDCVSDDYKVVVFLEFVIPITQRRRTFSSRLWVYSRKLDSWKQLDDIPCSIITEKSGIWLNGALHRAAIQYHSDRRANYSIVAFDLETENCRFFKLPSIYRRAYRLVELDGCLSFSLYNHYNRCLEVWSMKEYGVESSWTQVFSIRVILLEINDRFEKLRYAEIVSYSKRKRSFLIEQGFENDKNKFCWFNLDTNTFENTFYGEHNMKVLFPQVFIPSLVRIKGNEIEEHATSRKRKR